MMRRSFLTLLGASLSGCLTGPESNSPTPARTPTPESPTPSPTPERTETPLPNRSVSFPDGPKAQPDRPAELTLQTAISYVRTFHYRATFNQIWKTESNGADLSCEVVRAAQRGSRFRIVLHCQVALRNAGGNESGNVIEEHTVVYLLDENSLLQRPIE